jgi:hypothetical protein
VTKSEPSGANATVPIEWESSSEAMQSSTGVPFQALGDMQEAKPVLRPSFSLPMFERTLFAPSSTTCVPDFAVV